MATASIQSRLNGDAATDLVGQSRDDLAIGDLVTLTSVEAGTAYQWSLAYAPEGSSVVGLSGDPTSPTPGGFTVDKEGPYLIRLVFTDGTGTTEQFVRLRMLTAFASLKLVSAGERYDSISVPVDITAAGWADEQNGNLLALLGLVKTSTLSGNVVFVDKENGDFNTIQAGIDYAVSEGAALNNPWTVLVRPGTYSETLVFAPYVNVFGWPGTPQQSEGTPIVRIENTTASHSVPFPNAVDNATLSDLHFVYASVSGVPTISQTGAGTVTLHQCSVVSQGNGGVAYSSAGNTSFYDCALEGGTVLPVDYALQLVGTTSWVSLRRCAVTGSSGILVSQQSEVFLRDTDIEVSGTYGVNTLGADVQMVYGRISGATTSIAANPTGTGTGGGDLKVHLRWSWVENVSMDGQSVAGTASLQLGATEHGTLTTINGAALSALAPADTIFYDNALVAHPIPLTAENVQDALDEIYTYAQRVRTLDDAYDGGITSSGSGRTIIADASAVQIVDAPVPSDPIPPGNTSGNLEVVGSVKLGALTKPEVTLDPNPFDNGPVLLMGREIWANDAPLGSTALILGDASGDPTYHNYNLRVGTQHADGGSHIGTLYLRGGDAHAAIDAGSIYVQAGTAMGGAGGGGGDIYIAPGDTTAATPAGSTFFVRPNTATPTTLTAAAVMGAGTATAGDILFATDMGSFTVTFAGTEDVAAVRALFDATGLVTATGNPIVLTTVAKGPTAEVFFLSAGAGVDTSIGTFSGQAAPPASPGLVRGTWPDTMEVVVTAAHEISFGPAAATGPLVYNADTGKLTVPGLIDPTGIVFDEAVVPPTGANKGGIFVSDGSGGLLINEPYYVDAAGTATRILHGGAGLPTPDSEGQILYAATASAFVKATPMVNSSGFIVVNSSGHMVTV